MTSIYQIKIPSRNIFYIRKVILISVLFLTPFSVQADSHSLSLSVTPTLFQMSAAPLQSWESSIKVINNNRYPITVYANVVNFAPQGETGQGKFLPVFEDFSEGKTLAEWIKIESKPFTVSGEASLSIPFSVTVPEDASPGGHFAAIMVGTKPPDSDDKLQVKTSQIVTSLFFVRIAGDVIESGNIREFRAMDMFVDVPRADFSLRFENKGNVHLQPQGEILITNMWGKERGVIPVNQKTHFGNVLPDSIRNFEFTWKGEPRFSDIGRYKAEVTLAYGDQDRKFVTRTSYFWVIPIKAVVTVLGSLALFIWFVSWAIKAYIRRMLALSGIDHVPLHRKPLARDGDVLIQKRVSVQSPLRAGIKDFRERMRATKAFFSILKELFLFVWVYRMFFLATAVFLLSVIVAWYFIADVTKERRNYEVIIENPDADITLSSEDIIYDQENATAPILSEEGSFTYKEVALEKDVQRFSLVLVNSSDTPGAAASLQKVLESEFIIDDLRSDFGDSKERTVIVYDVSFQEEALQLSKKLNGALLSAAPANEKESTITVFIGNDYVLR